MVLEALSRLNLPMNSIFRSYSILVRLRQIDVEFMRRLQYKINIIPIIAKADSFTVSELRTFKQRVMSDLERYQINIYRLPECDSDEEEEIKKLELEIRVSVCVCVCMLICLINAHLTFSLEYNFLNQL